MNSIIDCSVYDLSDQIASIHFQSYSDHGHIQLSNPHSGQRLPGSEVTFPNLQSHQALKLIAAKTPTKTIAIQSGVSAQVTRKYEPTADAIKNGKNAPGELDPPGAG